MSVGYESIKTIGLDDGKIVQKLQKSQSMFVILSFLRKTQVLTQWQSPISEILLNFDSTAFPLCKCTTPSLVCDDWHKQ
jgi:hypothetical protein